MIGEGDIEKETQQVLKNLVAVIHASGGKVSDVIKTAGTVPFVPPIGPRGVAPPIVAMTVPMPSTPLSEWEL